MPRKAKIGRPTLYNADRCAEVVEVMGQGHSIAGYAGKIGVSRQTVYQWAEDHPEFSDALNAARAAAAAWWEDQGINLATGGDGNAAVVIFALKNRVSDEWRDKQEVDNRVTFAPVISGDDAKL